MKTNLDALYKTDKELELDGVWFTLSEETGFRLRRMGGANDQRVKKAMALYYKPIARQAENDTLSADKELEVLINVFFDVALVDWKGVEIDGKEIPRTRENAQKLFRGLPELFKNLQEHCSSMTSYKEDLGND